MSIDLNALAKESVWVEKARYADAERDYYSSNNSNTNRKLDSKSRHTQEVTESSVTSSDQRVLNEQNQRKSCDLNTTSIVSDIVRVRKLINKTLDSKEVPESLKTVDNQLTDRLNQVELENQLLKKTVNDLSSLISKLEIRVSTLEGSAKQDNKPKVAQNQSVKPVAKPAKQPALSDKKDDDNDSDIDLFGSDEDEEADEVKKKRLEEYAAKKSKKPGVIAKSSVVLDVKPWDDETDMQKMEEQVRQVQMDGLLWGASKLVPLAYGIRKLQIVTVIEDEKVSVEELTEKLEAIEDYVQSVDIAAFNKI